MSQQEAHAGPSPAKVAAAQALARDRIGEVLRAVEGPPDGAGNSPLTIGVDGPALDRLVIDILEVTP